MVDGRGGDFTISTCFSNAHDNGGKENDDDNDTAAINSIELFRLFILFLHSKNWSSIGNIFATLINIDKLSDLAHNTSCIEIIYLSIFDLYVFVFTDFFYCRHGIDGISEHFDNATFQHNIEPF